MPDKLKKEILEEYDEKFVGVYSSPAVWETFRGWKDNATADSIKSFLNHTIDRVREEERSKWKNKFEDILDYLELLNDGGLKGSHIPDEVDEAIEGAHEFLQSLTQNK